MICWAPSSVRSASENRISQALFRLPPLELARKPAQCLEYIVVHEVVYLLERHHNDRFAALMDQYLPDWRLRRDLLDKSPLAHEAWEY